MVALFLVTYGYNETDLRAQRRDDHVAYLKKLHEEGTLVAAGPYEDGSGGAILLQAQDKAAAEVAVAGDPFTQLDVTRDRSIVPWKITVGAAGATS